MQQPFSMPPRDTNTELGQDGETFAPSQPHLVTKPYRGKEPGDALLISTLSNQQPTIIEA